MQLYTTGQAAELLDVPRNLIAQWKHAGKVEIADSIPSHGRGNRGGREPLYRLDDLRPLAETYHRRKQRS